MKKIAIIIVTILVLTLSLSVVACEPNKNNQNTNTNSGNSDNNNTNTDGFIISTTTIEELSEDLVKSLLNTAKKTTCSLQIWGFLKTIIIWFHSLKKIDYRIMLRFAYPKWFSRNFGNI